MACEALDARPPDPPGLVPRQRKASLRQLLLSIAVASGLVYGVFWTIWTWQHIEDERSKSKEDVRRIADQATGAFASFLAERTEATKGAAAIIDPGAFARPGCDADMPSGFPVEPDGRPLGRYDLVRDDGTVVCTTDSVGPGRAATHDDRGAPWLEAGYELGTPTRHFRDPVTGRPAWAVAFRVGAPATANGFLASVVMVDTSADQLRRYFFDGWETEFVVWDEESGDVLSRASESTWTADDPGERIVVTRPIPDTTWQLSAGVARETAYEETWSEIRGGTLGLLAAMVALGLVTLLVHRRIIRPLATITEAARRTASGGTTSLDPDGAAELAELASTLNDLTAARAHGEELLKITAEDLAHSLERLDAVLANSADMVLIVNAEGRVTFASPAAVALCGPAATVGTAFTELIHPEDVATAASLVRPGASGESAVEVRVGGGDRGWRTVDIVARDLLSHRAVHGIIVNGRDVTERLAQAAERAALDEQLHQSQRLESLGALAGGIAHDFKNLLSVIVWTTDMVAADPGAEGLSGDLDEIREAASRGVDLAQQLLTFARRDQALPEPIDVGAELLGLTELLRRTLGDHIGLDLRVDEDLPAVRVNRSRFDQAVINLAVNARDAMGAGGRLAVTASEQLAVGPAVEPGRYVVVSVSDTGVGMPPDVARRAMEPFYTTKEPGQGTGLGLAIVHGIVTSAAGAVRIQSTPGSGTTVRLLLPACSERSTVPGEGPHAAPVTGKGEVVLVVEDDEPLRSLVERMLRAGSYTALGAGDPVEALAIAGRPEQPLDVVLTDLLMPGMSGADLAARLRDLRPGLPVVYMSAYTADVLEELLDGGGAPVVLEKPFTQRQLLDALGAALAKAGTISGR